MKADSSTGTDDFFDRGSVRAELPLVTSRVPKQTKGEDRVRTGIQLAFLPGRALAFGAWLEPGLFAGRLVGLATLCDRSALRARAYELGYEGRELDERSGNLRGRKERPTREGDPRP